MNTKTIIILVTGLIFVAMAATGFQIFFVGMMNEYDVSYTEGDVDWGAFNSSSYEGLKNTTETLENELNKTLNPGETDVTNTNFFDTTWNSLKTAVASVYYALGISSDMIQGFSTGIFGVLGVSGGWIIGGLIAIVSVTIILIIIGWWMGK